MLRLIYLLPVTIAAQDSLPELIVTASRTSEVAEKSPYSSQILTSQDLLDQATRTLPQAFLDTPGVLIQQTTPGHGSPYIRGFNGRQTLLLQDGIRLNNSTWRGGPVQYWNTVDSQAIDRVELIKSQGSVLYGTDAIGGTVSTFTKSSGFRDEDGYFSNGAAYYRFDTNSQSNLGRIEQRFGIGGKWGIMLGISAKDVGDIEDTALGRMVGTGYSEESLDFKFEYALSDSQTLTFAHSYLDQDDINRWHNTTANQGWIHGSSFTTAGSDFQRTYDQERSLTYAKFKDSSANAAWINHWQFITSFQRTYDSEFRERSNGRIDHKSLDLDTYGFSFQAESPWANGKLIWGSEYYQDVVNSEGFRNGLAHPSNRPIADDSNYHSLGIFTNYVRNLNERFSYQTGARFSYTAAQWDGYRPEDAIADQGGDGSWTNLSLSLRGNYTTTDNWSIYGGLSQAFRAPNLDDLTGAQFALNGLNSSGSPDVEPEHFLTAELGARFNNNSLSYGVTGYYTTIDDAIVRIRERAPVGTEILSDLPLVTVNGGDGYLYGFEAEAAWNFHPDWQLSGNVAWQDGNIEQASYVSGAVGEDTIRRLHPLTTFATLKWTHPDQQFWIAGRIQAASNQNNLSALADSDTQRIPVNGTPSHLITSIFTGWQASEDIQLNFVLENLTDEDYRIHGSGQNMPGRNFTMSVKFEW